MAATLEGATLTEQHRLAQLALRTAFLREFTRLWPLLNLDELDETVAAWIGAVVDLILLWRARSSARALSYYDSFREAEAGFLLPARDVYASIDEVDVAPIRTSLLVTGPFGVKSRIGKGFSPTIAKRTAFVDVAGASSRHVLNGGRRTVIAVANADEMAVGFSRITTASPCAFCAMLASRGPVYKSRAIAARTTERSKRGPGEKYHDHCGCGAEPAFSRDMDSWPERNRGFSQLWEDTTAGLSGKKALNAFRRAYEAQKAGA